MTIIWFFIVSILVAIYFGWDYFYFSLIPLSVIIGNYFVYTKKRKLAKITVNATDDKKMIKGKANFTMDHHTGSSTIHVYLRKMSGSIVAYNYELRFDK